MNVEQGFSQVDHESVNCVVKWYNSAKGYGFAVAPDLSEDVLLHRSILEEAGFSSIADGVAVTLNTQKTKTGTRATKILSVRLLTNGAAKPDEDTREYCKETIPVRVRWFDTNKGYGFVNEFGHSTDIFVGQDALRTSGLQSVETGEALSVEVFENEGKYSVHRVLRWDLLTPL